MGVGVNGTPSVPRLWPGETAVCIASGPSLTASDVAYCRGKARVIVVNNGYQLAPWADVLYAADCRWWTWHQGAPSFAGLKYSVDRPDPSYGVTTLKYTGDEGLELSPTGLRTGRNSGFQAVNLAVHFGVSRIVLLGYDLQVSRTGARHWHPDHPGTPTPVYAKWVPLFATLVAPLKQLGITIVNCSRETALTCFPRQPLEDTL